jgi:hypothetical protein
MVMNYFFISFFITFIIARFVSHSFHDRVFYGTSLESSKTLTGLIRRNTGRDVHHFHFGIFIFLISLFYGLFFDFSWWVLALSGVGFSLFLDQSSYFSGAYSNFFKEDYFSFEVFITSVFLHLFFGFLSIMIFS